MHPEIFEKANEITELECEMFNYVKSVLCPPRVISDDNGKFRIYKNREFKAQDRLDLQFFQHKGDRVYKDSQWFIRLIDGSKPDSPPIDFYEVKQLCDYLEEIFMCELAQ